MNIEHHHGKGILPNMMRAPHVKYITYYEDAESIPGWRTAVWELDKGANLEYFLIYITFWLLRLSLLYLLIAIIALLSCGDPLGKLMRFCLLAHNTCIYIVGCICLCACCFLLSTLTVTNYVLLTANHRNIVRMPVLMRELWLEMWHDMHPDSKSKFVTKGLLSQLEFLKCMIVPCLDSVS
jgi:hypothetical protein